MKTEKETTAKFETIDAETLLLTPLPPIRFIVDELLPLGLHILAGAAKIGKSWLALWWCLQIARGDTIWKYDASRCTVLYLCLEDSYSRIQNRLFDLTGDAPDNLHFAIVANQLGAGLEGQIESFVQEHRDTGLVVIDTLQYIRPVSKDANAYANDYRDMRALKAIADHFQIAILLVHHFRKERDIDPLNRISGTNGISGGVDTNFTLARDERNSGKAVMECVGRDIQYRSLELQFDSDSHLWNLVSDSESANKKPSDNTIALLFDYLKSVVEFVGTATDLASEIEKQTGEAIAANVLARKLVHHQDELAEHGIDYCTHRTHDSKKIYLKLNRVGCVGNDGSEDSGSLSDYPTQSTHPTQADFQAVCG